MVALLGFGLFLHYGPLVTGPDYLVTDLHSFIRRKTGTSQVKGKKDANMD